MTSALAASQLWMSVSVLTAGFNPLKSLHLTKARTKSLDCTLLLLWPLKCRGNEGPHRSSQQQGGSGTKMPHLEASLILAPIFVGPVFLVAMKASMSEWPQEALWQDLVLGRKL